MKAKLGKQWEMLKSWCNNVYLRSAKSEMKDEELELFSHSPSSGREHPVSSVFLQHSFAAVATEVGGKSVERK